MKVCCLASGSAGNSIYIESEEAAILVDAGVTLKYLSRNLSKIGKGISDIDAVLVTHEHYDHVKGIEKLDKLGIPSYMNHLTMESLTYRPEHVRIFGKESFSFRDMNISPIGVSHDAADPCSFRIKKNGTTIGIFTDIGKPNMEVINTVRSADCLVLETNHDVDMLLNGPYPPYLKQRILGDKGHLSNIDAGLLVKENASERLKAVFLAHLSKNNNTERLAFETFSKITEISMKHNFMKFVAKQDEPSRIFEI